MISALISNQQSLIDKKNCYRRIGEYDECVRRQPLRFLINDETETIHHPHPRANVHIPLKCTLRGASSLLRSWPWWRWCGWGARRTTATHIGLVLTFTAVLRVMHQKLTKRFVRDKLNPSLILARSTYNLPVVSTSFVWQLPSKQVAIFTLKIQIKWSEKNMSRIFSDILSWIAANEKQNKHIFNSIIYTLGDGPIPPRKKRSCVRRVRFTCYFVILRGWSINSISGTASITRDMAYNWKTFVLILTPLLLLPLPLCIDGPVGLFTISMPSKSSDSLLYYCRSICKL